MSDRKALIQRKTGETEIRLELNVDGTGLYEIETGIPFFNHMLDLLSKHSLIDLKLCAKGDLDVDYHHTVEDVGLALGNALDQALGVVASSANQEEAQRLADFVLSTRGQAFLKRAGYHIGSEGRP